MERSQIGGGIVALAAIILSWLLPVTFPSLQGPWLIAAWVGLAIAFAVGVALMVWKPKADNEPKPRTTFLKVRRVGPVSLADIETSADTFTDAEDVESFAARRIKQRPD